MTVVHLARGSGAGHASAVRRLTDARDEQSRLAGVAAHAVGPHAQQLADESLGEARAYVASREQWLHWIDEGESLAPWADGVWSSERGPSPPRDVGGPAARESGDGDDPDVRDTLARERDELSSERDRAAAGRDLRALVYDEGIADGDRGAGERRAAAWERAAAALDRQHAKRDRQLAARDRAHAAATHAAAGTDDLTGALRRGVGLAAVQREIERAHRTDNRLVIAFVDVDGLKKVNDSAGHAAGDRLLERVAKLIIAHMRPYDVVVRVGGDEFVCSLSGIDVDHVRGRFELVRADLATAPDAGSISVGLDELKPGDSIDDLVRRADAALLSAKGAERRAPETRVVTCVLPATPGAAAKAREAIVEFGLPERFAETLSLVVSELVTNSVRHAGLVPGDFVDLCVTHHAGRVRVAVHDRGAGFAVPANLGPDPTVSGARGLFLVDELCDTWGVDCVPTGCTVWCEVAVPAAQPSAPGGST